MPDPPATEQPTGSAPVPVRAQILSTEHWSLLATRSLAWSESFSRASWFVTVVSATVVALALVADSTDFGSGFRFFALLLIPLLVVIGVATVVRLVQLNSEDVELVIGMNRLRRGYLDLAPNSSAISSPATVRTSPGSCGRTAPAAPGSRPSSTCRAFRCWSASSSPSSSARWPA